MSSGVTFKGKINNVLLAQYEFAPKLPPSVTLRETGTNSYITARAILLRDAGYRVSTRQVGETPVWQLEARGEAVTQNLEDTHELRANLLNPDLKSNSVLQSKFTVTPTRTIAGVEQQANKVRSGEITYDNAQDNIEAGVDAADQTVALELLDLMLSGVEFTPQFQYVYVHTFNFSTFQSLTLDFSNVGKVFTTAGLIAEEGIPNSFNLPDGEWLKIAPEMVDTLGTGRVLKYEYWWAEAWSTLLYDAAT